MQTTSLNPSSAKAFSEPFDYFLVSNVFTQSESDQILNWLKSYKNWNLEITDFFEQYEFSLNSIDLPNALSFLKEGPAINELRRLYLLHLGTQLPNGVEVSAHKLVAGQTIRLHNDYLPEGKTHRIVIQINDSFAWDMGGLILLFNSQDPSDINRVVKPQHNSAIGFTVAPNTYHAVSKVHKGERYTIVYTFLE